MADLGIVIAGKLSEVIGYEAIKNICRMWGYENDLEQLNNTITTVKNVLLVAESMRELSMVQQSYIAELKDVIYNADDLFDEFRTLAELNMIGNTKEVELFAKLRGFFSSKIWKLGQAHRISRRVKEIKEHLDAVANDYTRFGFSVDYKPIVRRREDTCSYVDVNDIIGRDKDKEAIIDMLMDPNGDGEGFCFVTIVGVGGLGKTALAQLVYNHKKIVDKFASSRLWVCVSDQEGLQFDVRTILSKILEVATKKIPDNSLSMESVKNQFLEHFTDKKYFLVLDDIWNEDHHNWVKLKQFLMNGARGSKIVVTSRSEKTACVIRNKHAYKLEGLSKEDSQRLFEMSAFEGGEKHPELIKIGENIVTKCCGIPLAIKVVGSLVYGQDISKWQSVERSGLPDIGKGDSDKILSILKLSYYNLAPSLKSCFSYCAVFPKDFQMDKEMLFGLWMAQGYIVPLDGGQSIDDAVEEHFSILMRRCFFQDIKKDVYGNVVSVKIHDLMHDVAQEVGKDEICVVTSKASKLGVKIRHVNIGDKCAKISLCGSKIRSCICNGWRKHLLDNQIEKLTTLRVLDLSCSGIEYLPQTIGRLLLLRYLNLYDNNKLEVLPNSITQLYNLQTLILRKCKNLREIPEDFSSLIKLRHLDLYGCRKLKGAPFSILKLNSLRVLPYFVISNEILDEELKVLQQVFNKLKGKICVNNTGGMDAKSMKPLAKLMVDFVYEGEWVIHESVLEKLVLPPYLTELDFSYYNGTIPWSTLPHYLIRIEIKFSDNLEKIPVFSKLVHLKSLELACLDNVEYMENEMSNTSNETKAGTIFFPSLESLEITEMKMLKGWWKGDFPGMRLNFPRLSHLKIENCPYLTSFAPSSNPEKMSQHQLPSLCELHINRCPNLASKLICSSTLEKLKLNKNSERLLITGELGNLRDMVIEGNIEVETALKRVESCASSLRTIKFCNCVNMRRLPRLGHFIALEQLTLARNYNLSICEEDDEEHWISFPCSLRKLHFESIPKMKILPKGIQHLVSLQSLILWNLEDIEGKLPEWMGCLSSLQSMIIYICPGIKSLPEAFKELTSLKVLSIGRCPDLEDRCKRPNGEDFPKIQHIPVIDILSSQRSLSRLFPLEFPSETLLL